MAPYGLSLMSYYLLYANSLLLRIILMRHMRYYLCAHGGVLFQQDHDNVLGQAFHRHPFAHAVGPDTFAMTDCRQCP